MSLSAVFALTRGATEPVTSKQAAERVWEPKFVGEIMAGRDPRVLPTKTVGTGDLTGAELLDQYYRNYVEAEGFKSADTIQGHLKALKASLGDLPVTLLEKPGEILRFKAEFRPGHEVATVNRVLGALRAAINWGRFQDPPLLSTTTFHRFRSEHQGQRGNETGPARSPRRGAGSAGCVLDDELG